MEAIYLNLLQFESLETVNIFGFKPQFHSFNLEHLLTKHQSLKSVHFHMYEKYDRHIGVHYFTSIDSPKFFKM